MGLYEEKKAELQSLLTLLKEEKKRFEDQASQENARISARFSALYEDVREAEELKARVLQLATERQRGFPTLAKAYEELFKISDQRLVSHLRTKKHPAEKASDVVREQTARRRLAESELKIAKYIIEYYEYVAPFLVELKEEELDLSTDDEMRAALLKEYSDEELQDDVTKFMSKEEYRKLSPAQRNQLALERYWKRPKSNWALGKSYERYIGYMFEASGYEVEYHGIVKGFEDLGRDLVCKKGKQTYLIQCKYWSKFKTIYENHIFQFFGTFFQYRDSHPDENVQAMFYTSTEVSPLARKFAAELGIKLEEKIKLDQAYPCVKCNISRVNGDKIYHLPFDQQYDKTKIEPDRGEFYCTTCHEAEMKGFRRAFKYRPKVIS